MMYTQWVEWWFWVNLKWNLKMLEAHVENIRLEFDHIK